MSHNMYVKIAFWLCIFS